MSVRIRPQALKEHDMSTKAQLYKFCKLSKADPSDTKAITVMQSWIREEIAIPGAVLDNLEDPDTGDKTSGWHVDSASEPAEPAEMFARKYTRFGSSLENRLRS